jgi:hypothetical protein
MIRNQKLQYMEGRYFKNMFIFTNMSRDSVASIASGYGLND